MCYYALQEVSQELICNIMCLAGEQYPNTKLMLCSNGIIFGKTIDITQSSGQIDDCISYTFSFVFIQWYHSLPDVIGRPIIIVAGPLKLEFVP